MAQMGLQIICCICSIYKESVSL